MLSNNNITKYESKIEEYNVIRNKIKVQKTPNINVATTSNELKKSRKNNKKNELYL